MNNNKSIIIVGAGPGIAMGVAQKFGKEGYTVGLISRNETKLAKLTQELAEQGITSKFATADAGNPEELTTAIQSLRNELPAIETVHYNAAVLRPLNVLENDPKELANDLHVGIVGAVTTIQAVRNDLKATKGTFLLTGGGFADYPMAAYGSVSLAKAGIKNLTKQLHDELKSDGIYVGSVSVNGMVNPADSTYNPTAIGEAFYVLGSAQKEPFYNY
ncbi:MAG: SDR family oxidoreductase [Bacteroidota bacterium]